MPSADDSFSELSSAPEEDVSAELSAADSAEEEPQPAAAAATMAVIERIAAFFRCFFIIFPLFRNSLVGSIIPSQQVCVNSLNRNALTLLREKLRRQETKHNS